MTRRVARVAALCLIVCTVAIIGILVGPSSASTARSFGAAGPAGSPARSSPPSFGDNRAGVPGGPGGRGARVISEEDGVLPVGVTAFDGEYPGVGNLDAALLKALRAAARAAADDGVEISISSGWRSPAYQEELLVEAVAQYGSEAEAARWVATPATSPHVSGDAVDVGFPAASAWLSEHGAEYGLCQIYRNEPWHYELRALATARGCPRMFADPTRDPRMQP